MHKMLNRFQGIPLAGVVLFVLTVLPSPVFAEDVPLMMMRLRGPHTADDAQWAKTFKVLRENRAACDEVWFSTGIGFPKMAWHEEHVKRLARYAEHDVISIILESLAGEIHQRFYHPGCRPCFRWPHRSGRQRFGRNRTAHGRC